MIRVQRTSSNKYKISTHVFSWQTKRWTAAASWEEVGPVGLEAYLERKRIDNFYIRCCLFALANNNNSIAYFSDKGKLTYVL